MTFSLKVSVIFSIVSVIKSFDPELQLCQDLSIDAAVSADDDIDYIFKGDYYWQFSTSSGISNAFIAQPISERWPGLTGPIDAAFGVDEEKFRISTVFIKGNNWFLYNKNILQKNGTTDKWKSFPRYPIQGAFDYRFNRSMERKYFPIIMIYNEQYFIRYTVQNIENPKYEFGGKAYTFGNGFFYFLMDQLFDNPNAIPLRNLIDVKALMSNTKDLIFFGNKNFCIASMGVDAPQCVVNSGKNVSNYFGCPRSPYPTTVQTTITTMTTTSPPTTSPTTPTMTSKDRQSLEEKTRTPEMVSIETDSTPESVTDEPESPSFGKNVPKETIPEDKESNENNDWTLIIVVIVVIVIISLISIVVIVVLVVSRQKKSEKQTKEQNSEKSLKRTSSQESLGTALKLSKSTLIDNKSDSNSNDDSKKGSLFLQPSSDEALEATLKETGSSTGDYPLATDSNKTENTSSTVEADQLIQAIKSKEDTED